jgi:hypothetical protein
MLIIKRKIEFHLDKNQLPQVITTKTDVIVLVHRSYVMAVLELFVYVFFGANIFPLTVILDET